MEVQTSFQPLEGPRAQRITSNIDFCTQHSLQHIIIALIWTF